MTSEPAVPLTEPRDGLPDVVADERALRSAVTSVAGGHGPVAIDAERASGYRYGQRAYLVQLRRAKAGTFLFDPLGVPDLSTLGTVVGDAEWVLHAAHQDLPCLADIGMRPATLFDTELAARLLGLPRVGLAPLVESVLGFHLEKGHSAVDWSTRPLPPDWLRYAALDVELLLELRDALERDLRDAGKLEWAHEEFAAIVAAPPPPPRSDPWRRTSGVHRVRDRRGLAMVRELWYARDALARKRNLSPGRVLPDTAIVEAAIAQPASLEELTAISVFRGRAQRREATRWFAAITRARALSEDDLPSQTARYDGPPPARTWSSREPEAAARLASVRAVVAEIAEAHTLPVENLLAPDVLRRVTWDPPDQITEAAVAAAFRARGAREWQIRLTAGPVADALATA
ncbi:ribonuclease D [Actinobacteria bacterium YIM 96077]|uniref:Ribonuclease D n=1 Tax=Phytoactinopolyspora halophila TaxID=1981511 RepID=A0A329QYF0_9ACTN|nr:HRDC domain-containing protein [Phytoactinopolyspora halophila]AYY13410.1 ribonuclease D [Actinobacteria bacterium YIM 96077]RAW17355.1 ribonuclease D [Phytoactinopolyspora halophila]